MKVTHLLFPAALAVFLAAALPAMAAEEKPADAKADKAEVKPADAKTDKAAVKKKIKPHSHLEEKTGTPAKAMEETKPEDKDAAAKKKQHLHPRDGK